MASAGLLTDWMQNSGLPLDGRCEAEEGRQVSANEGRIAAPGECGFEVRAGGVISLHPDANQRPVYVTLGGIRRQRDADGERGQCVLKAAQAVGAMPVVEHRPEVALVACEHGGEVPVSVFDPAGTEVGPPEQNMVPRRAWSLGAGAFGQAQRAPMFGAFQFEGGTRAEGRFRLVEEAERVAMGGQLLSGTCKANAKPSADHGDVEQVKTHRFIPQVEPIARRPDFPTRCFQFTGVCGWQRVGDRGEPDAIREGAQTPPRFHALARLLRRPSALQFAAQILASPGRERKPFDPTQPAFADLGGPRELTRVVKPARLLQGRIRVVVALADLAARNDSRRDERQNPRRGEQGVRPPSPPLPPPLGGVPVPHPAEQFVVQMPSQVTGERGCGLVAIRR